MSEVFRLPAPDAAVFKLNLGLETAIWSPRVGQRLVRPDRSIHGMSWNASSSKPVFWLPLCSLMEWKSIVGCVTGSVYFQAQCPRQTHHNDGTLVGAPDP